MKLYVMLLEALIGQFGSMELKMLATLAKVNPTAVIDVFPKTKETADLHVLGHWIKTKSPMECAVLHNKLVGTESIQKSGAHVSRLLEREMKKHKQEKTVSKSE